MKLYYSTGNLGAAIGDARTGQSFFLIAIDGERTVGYASGSRIVDPWRDPSNPRSKAYHVSGWELKRIFLLPDYVGRGIGKELLGRWESFLREKGAARYYVTYHRSNRAAKEFYFRNGFVRAREYDDGAARCAVKVMRYPIRQTRPADSR